MPAAVAAAVAFAADVTTDYNHKADFARYHSYPWIGVKGRNSLWQDRTPSAVDDALPSKGWRKVPSGGDAHGDRPSAR